MYDYYRVRFRQLLGERRRPSPLPPDATRPRVPMPRALRFVYGASCALAAVGWISTLAAVAARGAAAVPEWAQMAGLLAVLLLPASVALALGFSEGQRWTRPLMLALLAAPAAGLALAGQVPLAAGFAAAGAGAAAWLYGSPAVRRYYEDLRRDALVRIERADLRSGLLVPLYTAAAGALAGAWLGGHLVTRHLGYTSGLGVNDAMAIVCTGLLCAVLLGGLGRWIGEGLVARWTRRHA